ncbi:hypothetical protein [Luteolibacter marinus]|uniref:hypothetical protein n=1 Tax=Luteolibacter marinus TaxID=2776705 RepID=UPI0018689134|nr:hypothetical protein [Luteolibacter marinus]
MIFLVSPVIAEGEWRVFTSELGQQLEAKVVKVDGDLVTLQRRSDGRKFVLEVDELSDEDQEWLDAWEEGSPPPTPAKEAEPAEGELKKSLYPRSKKEITAGLKEILGRKIPDGIDKTAGKAVNQLNAYRFLCGVPSVVEADATMNEQATEAAKACDKHGSLSHDLGHFTNICNLSGGPDVVGSVRSYIDDGGANNREVRGHRRWCLNPPMGKTGFGGADRFAAMVAMDSSGDGKGRDSWAYPGKGLFPLEYLHGDGWSLYLRESAPKKDDVTVEVFKLSDRPLKPLTWADKTPGKELEVVWVSTAYNAINFEPKEANKKGIYWVRVRGGGVREQYLVELY